MHRKVVLFFLLQAVVHRALGQGSIGSTLPCQDLNEDPDPDDNFSCPLRDHKCYSRAQLCDGIRFCSRGSDEGVNVTSLDCDNGVFVCTVGVNIPLTQLCDGVANCDNGDDEKTMICENKCLVPYYGGCSYTRQCLSSEVGTSCGGCLSGFAVNPNDPEGHCQVEIGFERVAYRGREMFQETQEICAVIFANPTVFVGGSPQGTFDAIGIRTITGVITPQESGGSNAAKANDDFRTEPLTVTLSPTQPRDCVVVPIVDDNIVDADEVFNIELTTSTPGVTVRQCVHLVPVTIIDNDPMVMMRLVPPVPPSVPETGSAVTVCVEITSGTLSPGQTATVNLATGDGTAQEPDDYTMVTMDLVFDNANDVQCIRIQIVDDDVIERPETFIVSLTENDPNVDLVEPTTSTLTITDNIAVITLNVVEPAMFQGVLQECANERLWFQLDFTNNMRKGASEQCVISVMTEDGSAVAGSDYSAMADSCTFTDTNTFCQFQIDILDDFNVEMDETFNILLASQDPSRCTVDDDTITVTIIDDEDCDDDVCGEFEFCEELRCPNNFNCIPQGPSIGDDPHFAVTLSSGKTLCYTVQGEHGFAFNLISNEKLYMNAMFVPDAFREEVTWLGVIGIVVNNNDNQNAAEIKFRFEAITNKIHIDNQMDLDAKNIEGITLENGKLIISEAPPTEGYKTPFVHIDLKDVELSFSIKFMTEHLDLYWHSTGQNIADSHGLIGQFFRPGMVLDEVRKMLILPGKEPVPIQRKPLWAFMEREVGDSTNFCWVAMNPGYQGEGLIDGSYFDYLVDNVLSTEFQFKK